MLKATALGCWRNQRELFRDLTFYVGPGSWVQIAGNNGSGKSTLLKIVAGLVAPCSGTVTWCDQSLKTGDPAYLSNLLYIGHKIAIQAAFTPLENLEWLMTLTSNRHYTSEDLIAALSDVGLGAFLHQRCESLSKGQCQRVTLARLWVNPAPLWILDEPATALDDGGIRLLRNRLWGQVQQGGSIVLASHVSLDNPALQTSKIWLGPEEVGIC